jgi:hypothetical protein
MSKSCNRVPIEAATISLAQACRRVGISVNTTIKLMPEKFPEAFWLGGKRVVARRRFEMWLAEKIDRPPSV